MNCLYCNKPIKETSLEENKHQWHSSCAKKFFSCHEFPKIDISKSSLIKLAKSNLEAGISLPGVQKKLSLHLEGKTSSRLTIIGYPSNYILKPQSEEYPFLPELEYLAMKMGEASSLRLVPYALIKIEDEFAYISKRIDRVGENKLAMEDFAQLDGRLSSDKYKGSYERVSKIIDRYSSRVGYDLSELYLRLVFSFIIGNSDMHLKNFSLIEEEFGSNLYSLSMAYDLLPTNLVLPSDKEEFALTMNGKKANFTREDFLKFASNIGLSELVANRIISSLINKEGAYLSLIKDSYLSDEYKISLSNLVKERIDRLKGNPR